MEEKPGKSCPQSEDSVKKDTGHAHGPFWRIWNGFTTVFLAVALLLAVLLAGVRLVGLKVFHVLSGSMEPVYHVGALVYVKPVDPAKLEIGDDITFSTGRGLVLTHRIHEILPEEQEGDGLCFRTKGLANKSPDANPVRERDIIGKVVFSVPYLGYVSDSLQKPPGLYIILVLTALFLLVPEFLADKKLFRKNEGEKSG